MGSWFRLHISHVPQPGLFFNIEIVFNGVVFIENHDSFKVAGIVRIKLFDEGFKNLGDLRHIPFMKWNLFSFSTLDLKGYNYISEGGALKVNKGAWIVLKGKRLLQIYVWYGSTVFATVI